MTNNHQFNPQLTADGSYTFFSEEFNEAFHSHRGAKTEALLKFTESCRINQQASNNNSLKLLDICYGLGYNSASALETIWSVNPQCQVELIGLELDLGVPQQAIKYNCLEQYFDPVPTLLNKLATNCQVEEKRLKAQLLIGDARQTIQSLSQSDWQADAIFLDPFSPPKCPQLWTVEFIYLVSSCLKTTGILATYSCAAAVRTALISAGLKIGSTDKVMRKTPGTIANFSGNYLLPLSSQELEHLQTRASIPYRDPQLKDSPELIWQRRQQEQQQSSLEPTTHWKKRWERYRGANGSK